MIVVALQGGGDALIDYILAHVATCLLPAFFIAGGSAAAALPKTNPGVWVFFGLLHRRRPDLRRCYLPNQNESH